MRLECFELTALGDRKINQDYMAHIINDEYGLFIVADGLGGHQAGEKASRYFCQGMLKYAKAFCKTMEENPVENLSAWINEAIDEMKVLFGDEAIADRAHTTCAILYLDNNISITGHCGDSRVYRMKPGKILWRTPDHSIPQELFDAGLISEQEIAQHPEQNQLTRCINVNKWNRVDIKIHPAIDKDETFVLCSDGFWEYVKPEDMLQLAEFESDKESLAKLVRLCAYRANGKSDNISVLSVRMQKN